MKYWRADKFWSTWPTCPLFWNPPYWIKVVIFEWKMSRETYQVTRECSQESITGIWFELPATVSELSSLKICSADYVNLSSQRHILSEDNSAIVIGTSYLIPGLLFWEHSHVIYFYTTHLPLDIIELLPMCGFQDGWTRWS